MQLNDVSLEFVLGALDGRGWVGDVKNMLLDITRIKTTGWNPRYTSEQAIRLATRSVVLPTYVPTLEQKSIDIGRS
jgi:UDP-glucose 4-epimerase